MSPPFSGEQFFDVFIAYNTSVWPIQIGLVLLAVAVVAATFSSTRWHQRLVPFALGALWLWMGVVYHWGYFVAINPVARLFGALFVVEGGLLVWAGANRSAPEFRPRADWTGLTGSALVFYALVAYPLIGAAVGHRYPAQPTFGLPCPTTIFTIGVLLWAKGRVPSALVVVPAFWAVVGIAAVRFCAARLSADWNGTRNGFGRTLPHRSGQAGERRRDIAATAPPIRVERAWLDDALRR